MKKIIRIALALLTLSLLVSCAAVDDDGEDTPGDFVLTAIVGEVGEKIEVEVIESDYAFGTYLVITSDATEFIEKDGNKISKSDLKSGDKIEITYGGQTMMSLPPQIVAQKIVVK